MSPEELICVGKLIKAYLEVAGFDRKRARQGPLTIEEEDRRLLAIDKFNVQK